ncbi:hypothetical protein DNJ95_00235 [Stutzerimonas kirkiae]|uniref:Uncharacterized protein n=1 Tax=Stutzerimonas kirkiae TaxID=2211392 RepID=A0A4V2KCF8_9GAMM|nr:hypothetical protein DNJ96_13430 [Stutzerimonas kirkiae]TBV06146.1 hypothetical protein DNJ95_00235 [Stutzerimonas kirkiae]TBV06588.1 hypothetical protein DNK08_14670 [Stutzerimonas kirkiae]TBV13688.1 hypothetical protein DNK01_10900 [Stutzerimonas kirkiae]
MLRILLEFGDIGQGFALASLQQGQQVFQFPDARTHLGLCLGLAGGSGFIELGTGLEQFFLGLATLLFQLGEDFFGIVLGFMTGLVQMLEQTAGKLLQQVQRGSERLLLRRHEGASWRLGCGHTRPLPPARQ